jgi:hypothetical protein
MAARKIAECLGIQRELRRASKRREKRGSKKQKHPRGDFHLI